MKAGVIFPTHMGGKSGFEKLFPTHFAGPWVGNRGLFPTHSADPGWEIEVISHPYAGKSGPPQAEILRIWGFEILDFLYKNVFWGPKILKKFRLRRAIRMLSFLYKMYFRDQNPTKFPPAASRSICHFCECPPQPCCVSLRSLLPVSEC